MGDVDALLDRASCLAEKGVDEKVRQQLVRMMNLVLTLMEAAHSGAPPASEAGKRGLTVTNAQPPPPDRTRPAVASAQPPPPDRTCAPPLPDRTRPEKTRSSASAEQPNPPTNNTWAQKVRDAAAAQPNTPKGSTWAEKTRRTRPKAVMVLDGWGVPKVESGVEMGSKKGGVLVAANTEDAEYAWGAALDLIGVCPGAKVAVVCTVPWAESARHLVVLSDGNHQDVWAKYYNVTPPTVSCKTVAPGQPTTQVCLFQVRAAYVHATTWETAMKAGQSVRIMAKKAAEAEGLRMDWSSVFTKVHRRQGVCEVSVRVPVEDVPKLLRSSGKAGTFWKAMSFVNGTDTLPAVWVSDCALEEARQIASRTPNTFGVIGGAKTGVFGIRTTPEHVAATESAVGKKLSKRQRRGDKYIVTTACPAEHPSDLLAACAAAEWNVEPVGSFKRRGDTVCVVIADQGPPAPVLYRLDRASISIRKYDRSIDARQKKGFTTQCQRVKINLPREFLASLHERPEPVPGQKRSRASDETTTQDKVARVDTADNMATDCRHANWQEAYENDKAFLCEVCCKSLVLDLVEALGLHERVLAPLRHVYKYLRRRFKYPLGVGDEFKVTNGILQGCPISVVLINALLSVLSKALVSRARVSPKSFADDLYLLSRLAKLLQEGIEVTAIFGSLTGLALNEGKCASFSTSEKGPRLEVGGKAVKSVKTVKVLGVPLGTEGPVDNGRSDATVEAAARLEASPLKPRTKFRVMQTIAASAHYGAAYCANSAGGFANNSVLRTALSACLIPRSNRAKSPLATLTLVAKAHLCDPACASGYSSLRTAAKQYQKERFRLRMDALLVSGADASLKGPVGLISNLLREIRFLPAKRHSFELLSFEGATVPFSGKETLHFVREGLRLRAWRYLTTQRQGYSGIERGVDVRLLNRLWQNRATEDRLSFAIRKCIAGAVYSREWCNRKWGTDDGTCFGSGRRTRLHNALRDIVADFARRGLLGPSIERAVFANARRKRPDISYVRDGTTVLLDVAVTYPLQLSQPHYAARAAAEPGGAAAAYAVAVKERVYNAIIANEPDPREWKAVPLVVDTFGAWCPGAITELRHIARANALREDRTVSAACQDLFHRLSFSIARGVARIVIASGGARPDEADPP
ncbi:RNA-directed DNA polymerase from mobile element jockey [Diplonema papillatum]|nr:RNA-directed DNA polymerase from mobile element jockey [Diplonema papillatum]